MPEPMGECVVSTVSTDKRVDIMSFRRVGARFKSVLGLGDFHASGKTRMKT
jgi:hypothetical protein